jgi:signal transduction histidine kinase
MRIRAALQQPLPYLYAFLTVLLATALRVALIPLLGADRFPFITAVPAVIFCTWRCGLGPSIFAALVCVLSRFWLLHTLRVRPPFSEAPNIMAFLFIAGLVIAFAESNRRDRRTLEARVRDRTATLNHLSARLLEIQDTERRHIARELHDGLGQLLASASINVSALRKTPQSPPIAEKLADTEALIQEALREARSLSHLLHPPLLEELGLCSAVEWYVKTFTERSGIAVTVDVPHDFPRLSPDTEIALFRVIQESLTNIHRHSGSASAVVQLAFLDGISLTVRDFGKGIPPQKLAHPYAGLGLRSMTERISQLGGTLQLTSENNGTTISAVLPLRQASQPASAA